MLVLSRKCQESVMIGGEVGGEFGVKVTVIEMKSGKVRLGFDVDPGVPVHRWEVWERIRAAVGQSVCRAAPAMSEFTEGVGPSRNGAIRARGRVASQSSEDVSGTGLGGLNGFGMPRSAAK